VTSAERVSFLLCRPVAYFRLEANRVTFLRSSTDAYESLSPGIMTASGPSVGPSLEPKMASGVRLATLVAACSGILTPVVAGQDDRQCRSVEIGEMDQSEDAVVLIIGTPPERIAAWCADLGRKRAAAVIVDLDAIRDEARLAAREAGLCLLGRRPGSSWAQLFTALSSIVGGWTASGLEALVHEGNNLTALVHTLASRLGNPLTIETAHGEVAAYSAHQGELDAPRRQTILAGASPEPILAKMRRAGIFRRIDGGDEPLRVEAPTLGITPRVAMPIREAGEVLGYLWVMERDRHLNSDDMALLRHGARLAAFHLLRLALEADADQRLRDELICDVVRRAATRAATSDELISARAESIGMDAQATYEVVIVSLDQSERDVLSEPSQAEVRALKRRLFYVVGFEARITDPEAVYISIADSVLVLLPRTHITPTRASEFATRALKACRGASPPVHASVGIGPPAAGLISLPLAYEAAMQAVAVAQRVRGGDTVVGYDGLGAYRLLAHADGMPGADLPISPAVALLQVYDARRGSHYCQTLSVYLDSFGDRAHAARQLKIHHNTLAYRLNRIGDITGLDFNDAEGRLAAQLHLRAAQLHPATLGSSHQ
jgi:sugar diacid utilization regulator